MTQYNRSIFISHSWNYSSHYEKLADWIFGINWDVGGIPIRFIDTSVPKDDPIHYARNAQELRAAIYRRIAMSDVVVIPTGMYVNYSEWIQKEIDGAYYHSKPIVAVNPWGQERKSSAVLEACTVSSGWQKDSVVKAIWRVCRSPR